MTQYFGSIILIQKRLIGCWEGLWDDNSAKDCPEVIKWSTLETTEDNESVF